MNILWRIYCFILLYSNNVTENDTNGTMSADSFNVLSFIIGLFNN